MSGQGGMVAGSVALVTGAAHGIGLGIASAFAREGAAVVLADLREGAAVEAAAEIARVSGSETLGVGVDVRDRASVAGMCEAAVARFGRIDVLVNNAGIYPNTPFLEVPEAEWDAVFDTNVKGMYLVTQAVARRMVDAGVPGRIINLSSGSAVLGRRGASHYCASKAAVNMLTKVLAIELGPLGITVNALQPGLITVPDADLAPDYVETLVRGIPVGHPGLPEDIANGALWLASPASGFVNGSVVAIDGGSTAGRNVPFSSNRRAGPE